MVTNKDETKPMRDHISCDCKWKFNSTNFFYSIIMMKFGKTEIAKEKFYAARKTYKNLGC